MDQLGLSRWLEGVQRKETVRFGNHFGECVLSRRQIRTPQCQVRFDYAWNPPVTMDVDNFLTVLSRQWVNISPDHECCKSKSETVANKIFVEYQKADQALVGLLLLKQLKRESQAWDEEELSLPACSSKRDEFVVCNWRWCRSFRAFIELEVLFIQTSRKHSPTTVLNIHHGMTDSSIIMSFFS